MDKAQAEVLFTQADDLFSSNQYAEALAILDRLDAAYPNTRRIMYPRARCLGELGRYEEALQLCDEIIEQFEYTPAFGLKRKLSRKAGRARSQLRLERESAATRKTPIIAGAAILVALVGSYLFVDWQVLLTSWSSEGNSEASAQSTDKGQAEEMPPIDTSGEPELVRFENRVSEEGVTVNASVEYGVWTNVGSYDAFKAKFASCEPAAIRMQTMGTFIMEYRILGIQDGECRIEMTAVNMPVDSSWQGKSMVCPCDNTKEFIKVTEEIGPAGMMEGTLVCDGPLFDAMRATYGKNQGQ